MEAECKPKTNSPIKLSSQGYIIGFRIATISSTEVGKISYKRAFVFMFFTIYKIVYAYVLDVL